MEIPRPKAGDCTDELLAYANLPPDGPILETLTSQIGETVEMLLAAGEAVGDHRYAPGKWTVKEVVGHMADAELVFGYRALSFARGDSAPLPGYDQDDWMPAARFGERPFAELVDRLRSMRAVSLTLFAGFPAEAWSRRGVACDAEIVVSAFPWVYAGHELHHCRILRERYGL